MKTLIAKGINLNEEKRKQYIDEKQQRILNMLKRERKARELTLEELPNKRQIRIS
nr:hypothetical protein [Orientia tsutsugamushi]